MSSKLLADAGSMPGTALETMGNTLDKDYGRDAVHLATIATVAAENLLPGQDIGLTDDKQASGRVRDLIGIVDPFIIGTVKKGDLFWMVLYPRTITSLRHVWTHPSFPNENGEPDPEPEPEIVNGKIRLTQAQQMMVKRAESEEWLRKYFSGSDVPPYDVFMGAVREKELGEKPIQAENDGDNDYVSAEYDHEYFSVGGVDAHGEIPPEVWNHVEIVLGRKVGTKPEHFSCSC